AGVPAAKILQEELGLTNEQVGDIGRQGLDATTTIEALMRGMDKRYGGLMEKQSKTLKGMLANIKDVFNNSLVRRWGEGLSSGVTPVLTKITDWFNKNQKTVKAWGNTLFKAGEGISNYVAGAAERALEAVKKLINSDEWKNAETPWDKAKVAWNKLIAEPFDEWWQSGGKTGMMEKGKGIAKAIGTGMHDIILGLLGLQTDVDSAGSSLAGAFIEGFRPAEVGDAIWKGIQNFITEHPIIATFVLGGGAINAISGLTTIISSAINILPGIATSLAILAPAAALIAALLGANKIMEASADAYADKQIEKGSFAAEKGITYNILKPFVDESFREEFNNAAMMAKTDTGAQFLDPKDSAWKPIKTALEDAGAKTGKSITDSGDSFSKDIMATADALSRMTIGERTNPENIVNEENYITYMNRTNPFLQHAEGGIMTRPHYGLVAEAGAEAIIPLSGNRRERGLALWERTGEMLGAEPYSYGEIFNTPSTGAEIAAIPMTIGNISFEVNITGGNDTASIIEAIKANIGDISDQIAQQIAVALQRTYANIPLAR
ncbi:MAG: hypothetical protein LBT88_07410, partial [Oscillospiraceae bacterium]|nr:hypothetical protein [Oscillospiraceae bacterium]